MTFSHRNVGFEFEGDGDAGSGISLSSGSLLQSLPGFS